MVATAQASQLAAMRAKARAAKMAKTGIPARFASAPAYDPEGSVARLFARAEARRDAAAEVSAAELAVEMVDANIEVLRAQLAQGGCVGREAMARELDRREASREADLAAALAALDEARERSSRERGSGLVVYGPTGTGKTYRASTVARAWAAAGKDVLFVDAVTLADRARASAAGEGERRGELVAHAERADLLVIDDLGRKSATAWFVTNVLFKIANSRYNAGLDTVVTTQALTPGELAGSLAAGGADAETAAAVVRRLVDHALRLDTRTGTLVERAEG